MPGRSKGFWLDDQVIEEQSEEVLPEVRDLVEALQDEYQPWRLYGIVQAWYKFHAGIDT